MPHFYARSGELAAPDAIWTSATQKITEAVCCPGCQALSSARTGQFFFVVVVAGPTVRD